MIRPDRLTIKAQEAFRDAAQLAGSRGNPVINDAHLFLALLNQDEGVIQPLLQKAGVDVAGLSKEIEREIDRFPKQKGEGSEPTFSRELNTAFDLSCYLLADGWEFSTDSNKGTAPRRALFLC